MHVNRANLRFMLDQLGAVQGEAAPPRVEDFALRAPRISPPAALAAMFSSQPLDRLNHSYGKSYADLARMWLRDVPEPPDWVAYPDDEQAIVDLLDWAARHNVAVVPYGGGSSVCGGVEPAVGAVTPARCRWTWNGCTGCWRWTAPAAPRASRPARWGPSWRRSSSRTA
jgi:alkyldihydroxyacetonephosphate synthase